MLKLTLLLCCSHLALPFTRMPACSFPFHNGLECRTALLVAATCCRASGRFGIVPAPCVSGSSSLPLQLPVDCRGHDTLVKDLLPTVLLTPPASKAANMVHLCFPQNQALGVCRGFVSDIQVCDTHGREDLVNATITSNAEEEEGLTKVRRAKT